MGTMVQVYGWRMRGGLGKVVGVGDGWVMTKHSLSFLDRQN